MNIDDELFMAIMLGDKREAGKEDRKTIIRNLLKASGSFSEWFRATKAYLNLTYDDMSKKNGLTRQGNWDIMKCQRNVYLNNIILVCYAFDCIELVDDVVEKFCVSIQKKTFSVMGVTKGGK